MQVKFELLLPEKPNQTASYKLKVPLPKICAIELEYFLQDDFRLNPPLNVSESRGLEASASRLRGGYIFFNDPFRHTTPMSAGPVSVGIAGLPADFPASLLQAGLSDLILGAQFSVSTAPNDLKSQYQFLLQFTADGNNYVDTVCGLQSFWGMPCNVSRVVKKPPVATRPFAVSGAKVELPGMGARPTAAPAPVTPVSADLTAAARKETPNHTTSGGVKNSPFLNGAKVPLAGFKPRLTGPRPVSPTPTPDSPAYPTQQAPVPSAISSLPARPFPTGPRPHFTTQQPPVAAPAEPANAPNGPIGAVKLPIPSPSDPSLSTAAAPTAPARPTRPLSMPPQQTPPLSTSSPDMLVTRNSSTMRGSKIFQGVNVIGSKLPPKRPPTNPNIPSGPSAEELERAKKEEEEKEAIRKAQEAAEEEAKRLALLQQQEQQRQQQILLQQQHAAMLAEQARIEQLKQMHFAKLQQEVEIMKKAAAEKLQRKMAEEAEKQKIAAQIKAQIEAEKKKLHDKVQKMQKIGLLKEQLAKMIQSTKEHDEAMNVTLELQFDWDSESGWTEWDDVEVLSFPVIGDPASLQLGDQEASEGKVRWRLRPFGKGAFRFAYYGQLKQKRKITRCVIKFPIESIKFNDFSYFKDDVESSLIAAEIARKFNEHSCTAERRRIEYIEPKILHFTVRTDRQYAHMEPILEGAFTRFTNNMDHVTGDRVTSVLAFGHFSWHFTRGELMVVDLQGVRTAGAVIMTDPALHRRNPKGGHTDYGTKGMALFFKHHKCNPICVSMGLTRHAEQSNESDPRATVKQEY